MVQNRETTCSMDLQSMKKENKQREREREKGDRFNIPIPNTV